MHRIKLSAILLAVIALSLFFSSVQAKDKKNDEREKHPISILKAELDRDGFDSNTTCVKRTCIVWVKNISRHEVKDVKVNLKIKYNTKVLQDLTETIESLEPGKRVFVNFKWEDYDMKNKFTPEIHVTYPNDEGKEVTFQANSLVW